jgi:predicted ATPase
MEGMPVLRQGLALYRATGAELNLPFYLALLVEAHARIEQGQKGLCVLNEALALVNKNDECFYEAELYRLKGVLVLASSMDDHSEAEACFHQALAIACRQEAKSLELRAATSLARLWQKQGKRDEARELITSVYGWVTEGFDTADLQDAKTLVHDLS